MHTAPHETLAHEAPAHGPLAFLSRFRFMRSEDTMIATLASWTIGLVIFTLAGFYLGTIAGHDNHPNQLPNAGASIVTSAAPAGAVWREPGMALHKDIDPAQLGIDPFGFTGAIPYAAAGLLCGLIFALLVTFKYVPDKLRELESEQGGHH